MGEHENASSEAKMEKMKQIVAELSKNVQPIKIRVSIRRKSVFKD